MPIKWQRTIINNIIFKSTKYPLFKQLDSTDCGPTCIKMIAKFHGKDIPLNYLRAKSSIDNTGVSLDGLEDAAKSIYFKTIPVHISITELSEKAPLPCILYWNQNHFVVLYKANKNHFIIADPDKGIKKLITKDFLNHWSNDINETPKGYALLLEPTKEFYNTNIKDEQKRSFKYLIPYFKPFKKELIAVILAMAFALLIQLSLPFLTQSIIDYGINLSDLNFIYIILLAQIILFISQSTIGVTRSWIMLYVTRKVNIKVLSDFIDKMQSLRISFFDSRNKGDIIQRIQENSKIEELVSNTTLEMIFNILSIVVFSIVLFLFHPQIFLLFIIATILYFLWTLLFMKKLENIDYEVFQLNSKNHGQLIELVSSPKEVKINNSRKKRQRKWIEIQENIFNASIHKLKIDLTQSTGSKAINELKNILLTFFSAKLVIDGELTLGTMLAIQYIIGQLNTPLQNMASFIILGQESKLSLDRLLQVMGEKNENHHVLNKTINKFQNLKIKNLSFKYGSSNSREILSNITMEIPKGKTTAIVGDSGSGKTTLFNIILKFYDTYNGKISIGNKNLHDLDHTEWRKLISCVNQDGYIFNDSLLSNITESEQSQIIDEKRLKKAIEVSNLQDVIEKLPSGIRSDLGPNGSNISGGERQRVLIARAIYKESALLVLDEATSALDAKNESDIHKALMRHFKDKTVVIIAHRLSTVKQSHNIIVLHDGQISEQGTHQDLIKQKGAYYTLVKNQLELSR